MSEEYPSCSAPFGGATVEYPIHFDLRIIYRLAEAPDMPADLEAMLKRIGVPCSLIQGTAKPKANYGRIGARISVESKEKMNLLYLEAAKLPGVKAVI